MNGRPEDRRDRRAVQSQRTARRPLTPPASLLFLLSLAGESIEDVGSLAEHTASLLGLPPDEAKRLAFEAVTEAVHKDARGMDMNVLNAKIAEACLIPTWIAF